ncbi:TetR/AcrR family transcriptional regulator [Streptomyces sp. NPDC092296]|uniref:TetR/AcrR family transcriptional regulator n=1 Tax=Streptomyces sp. NPDC092296 TaxID=3366012 RepID=UPI003826EFBD
MPNDPANPEGPSAIDSIRPPAAPGAKRSAASARRSESARVAVLSAADDLLAERGFDGVTIEGIAARAGVAKQTIYRWWKSKAEILYDNLLQDAEKELVWPQPQPQPQPQRTAPADALRSYLRTFCAFLCTAPAGRVLQTLIGQAQLDPGAAATVRDGFLREQRARDLRRMHELLPDLGVDAPTEQQAAEALDALLAPVYYRVLVLGEPADAAFADAQVDLLLARIAARRPA